MTSKRIPACLSGYLPTSPQEHRRLRFSFFFFNCQTARNPNQHVVDLVSRRPTDPNASVPQPLRAGRISRPECLEDIKTGPTAFHRSGRGVAVSGCLIGPPSSESQRRFSDFFRNGRDRGAGLMKTDEKRPAGGNSRPFFSWKCGFSTAPAPKASSPPELRRSFGRTAMLAPPALTRRKRSVTVRANRPGSARPAETEGNDAAR